jgi:hypothetical protein
MTVGELIETLSKEDWKAPIMINGSKVEFPVKHELTDIVAVTSATSAKHYNRRVVSLEPSTELWEK